MENATVFLKTFQRCLGLAEENRTATDDNRWLLATLCLTGSSLLACSATTKKTESSSQPHESSYTLTEASKTQGPFLVGTNWKYCSYVYTAHTPTGDASIFELTKIAFTTANDIKMIGEAYSSDEHCNTKLTHDELVKIAGPDYSSEFFKFSDQSFKYRVAAEANPNGTYDFDVTDDTGYQLYTEIRLQDRKFELGYACLTEDNIKAGDCSAVDGDSPARRARNFKTEDLVISWSKWE